MYDKSNDLPGNGPVHPLKALTPAEFMALGGKAVVYVKPMTGEALSEMTGNSDFGDADEFQLVVSADGSPLLIADSEDAVVEWLRTRISGSWRCTSLRLIAEVQGPPGNRWPFAFSRAYAALCAVTGAVRMA